MIDENGRYINEKGEYVYKNGQRVDDEGDYLVEFKPFLDNNGNPIVSEKEKTKDESTDQSIPQEQPTV